MELLFEIDRFENSKFKFEKSSNIYLCTFVSIVNLSIQNLKKNFKVFKVELLFEIDKFEISKFKFEKSSMMPIGTFVSIVNLSIQISKKNF